MAQEKEIRPEEKQNAETSADKVHRLAHEFGLEHHHSHDGKEGHGHHHPNSKAVSNRLAKAIGHLEAVKRMVDREEDCSEILTQLAAVRSAINNAGKVILMDHLNHCIVEAVEENDMEKIKEFGDAIQKFVK